MRAQRLTKQVGHEAVVPASAVIGCLGHDGNRRTGEPRGRIQTGGRARPVQDKNVLNTTAAKLVDEQREGGAPETTGHADDRPGVDHAESVSEWPEGVERIAGLQLREQPRSGADCFEHEPAGVVLGPGDAERSSKQRRGALAAAQLRKGPRQRRGGKVRQPRHQLQEPAPEPLHHEDLTRLASGPAQIRGHDTACTTPSR